MSTLNRRQIARRFGLKVAEALKDFGIAKAKKNGKYYLLLYRPIEGEKRSNLADVFECRVTAQQKLDDTAQGHDLLVALHARNDMPLYWRLFKAGELQTKLAQLEAHVNFVNAQTADILKSHDFRFAVLGGTIMLTAFGDNDSILSLEKRLIDHGIQIEFESGDRLPDPSDEAKAKAEAVLKSARGWLEPMLRTILDLHGFHHFQLITQIVWNPFTITIQAISPGERGLTGQVNSAVRKWREHVSTYVPAELAEIDGRAENKLTLRRRIERWLGI